MDNVKLIYNYFKSLDEADILEIMEHISTEELEAMLDRELDCVAMLRMLGAPEIENPDEVRQGRVVFPGMPSTIMDFMAYFLEVFGLHVSDHMLLAAVLIKNKKINTAQKEELLADTVARVHFLDQFIHRFYIMVTLIRSNVNYFELTEAEASLLQLLGLFMRTFLNVMKALDDSMPQWWSVGMTRLDITPAIDNYEFVVLRAMALDVFTIDKDIGVEDDPYIRKYKEFTVEEISKMRSSIKQVINAHDALTRIALPPVLIDAVEGMEKMAARLPAATSKKVNRELAERFKAMNNNMKFYWLAHNYDEFNN